MYKHCFLIVFLLICLNGCTVITSDSIENFQLEGEMDSSVHYRTVMEEMGPPTDISRLGDGMVWLFEEVDVEEKQFGINFDYEWLSLFKFSFANAKGIRRGIIMTFDHDGFITTVSKISKTQKLGGGFACQFIFVVTPLVDVKTLTESKNQHHWGKTLLSGLPHAINTNSDLGSGAHGLQQLDTPEDVGQHTLDLDSSSRNLK